MFRSEGLLVYFDVPEIGLAVKDPQYLVNQKHLASVPIREYLEPIHKYVVEADDKHVHNLVVLDLEGPLHNEHEQQQVVGTEHVQQQWIVHILNQLRKASSPSLCILALFLLLKAILESSSNDAFIDVK